MADSTVKPMDGVTFLQQPYAFRIQHYVSITVGFVVSYHKIDPDVKSVPELIDWFIQHDTNLQAESPKTRRLVRRMVGEAVSTQHEHR